MKLLALKAIRMVARRTHAKIWARSTQDNMDHDLWFKLAVDLGCYSRNNSLKVKYIKVSE